MPLWATKESSQLLKVKFGVALSLPEAAQTGTDVAQALLLPVRAVCGDTSYRIVLTVHWLILMLKNHAPGCIGSSCVWMGTALCSARASLQLSVREGIMLPWHWRISPLLGDKADAQCSQERRGTSSCSWLIYVSKDIQFAQVCCISKPVQLVSGFICNITRCTSRYK